MFSAMFCGTELYYWQPRLDLIKLSILLHIFTYYLTLPKNSHCPLPPQSLSNTVFFYHLLIS